MTGPCEADSFVFNSETNPRAAGGGAIAAPDDLKLLQMHLRGGICGEIRVITTSSVEVMQCDQTDGAILEVSPYRGGRRYGLSWWLSPEGQIADEVSDLGALGSTPWLDRDHQFGEFLLLSRGLAFGTEIWDALWGPLWSAARSVRHLSRGPMRPSPNVLKGSEEVRG